MIPFFGQFHSPAGVLKRYISCLISRGDYTFLLNKERLRSKESGMKVALEGVFSVLPTPFMADGEVDRNSLERVIDLFLQAGVNGFTALGVTSEVARLSDRERSAVLEIVLNRVNGRVPVVVGATANSTPICLEYSKEASQAGASAVMVSPPRMQKLNSRSVVHHFCELAEAVDIPIVVQDFPAITGYSMEPRLLVRLAREIPAARTIKLEDPPTPVKIARILEQGVGIPIKIFGGLGGMYFLEELLSGATGAMTGFACPEILIHVFRLFLSGQVDEAADIFYRNVPLMRFEFQEGIGLAIRKEILRRRGVLENASVRAPGPSLDDKTASALDLVLEWVQKNGGVSWISD